MAERRPGPSPLGGDERGSVSVLAATVCGFAVVLVLFTLDVSAAIAAKSRAQSAADAAALAAAAELALPTGKDPASLAASYAEWNGARLVSCRCDEGSDQATVTVAAPIRLAVLGSEREVRVSARAVVDARAIFAPTAGGAGLQPWFARRLSCLARLVQGIELVSGFRTHAEQARLYREKPNLAAPPGHSLHELGLAADLAFPSEEAEGRAHALAGTCGLAFPVPGEPWHTSPTALE
jgi:secretion/DNA translocation related TadE-like protein